LAPQPPQNFSLGPFAAPHAGQMVANAAPHSPQNRRSELLS
jgi:hypothetical protein